MPNFAPKLRFRKLKLEKNNLMSKDSHIVCDSRKFCKHLQQLQGKLKLYYGLVDLAWFPIIEVVFVFKVVFIFEVIFIFEFIFII